MCRVPAITLPHPDPPGGGHEAAGFIFGNATVAIVLPTLLGVINLRNLRKVR